MEPLKGVHSQLLLGGGQNLKIPIYGWIKSGAPPKVFGCFRGCLHPSHDPPSKVLEVRFSEVGTESFSVSLPFSFFKKIILIFTNLQFPKCFWMQWVIQIHGDSSQGRIIFSPFYRSADYFTRITSIRMVLAALHSPDRNNLFLPRSKPLEAGEASPVMTRV